jgi:hypothetical protein
VILCAAQVKGFMRIRTAVPLISSFFLFAVAILPAYGQQRAASAPEAVAACGPSNVRFAIKSDAAPLPPQPARRVLIYLIQDSIQSSEKRFLTVTDKMRIGVDGKWVGATQNQTYLSFVVDPGVHHLCVSYQGEEDTRFSSRGEFGPQDGIILHRMNLEAGSTYYFRIRYAMNGTDNGLTLLDEVDEDEGRFLVQTTPHATSRPK